jgi:hypothetical protein
MSVVVNVRTNRLGYTIGYGFSRFTRVTPYPEQLHHIPGQSYKHKHEKSPSVCLGLFRGDPKGNRTPVAGMKTRCPNR